MKWTKICIFSILLSLNMIIDCFYIRRVISVQTKYLQSSTETISHENENTENKFTRRIRYKGSYPKTYKEKYKEINGDTETIKKVIEQGRTPAGQHLSIMMDQCIDMLGLNNVTYMSRNDTIVVDCTFGYGGHSKAIMKKILPKGGRLISIDQDKNEMLKSEERLRTFINTSISVQSRRDYANNLFQVHHLNFANLSSFLHEHNLTGKITGVLADLGFSSMQIDNPERGFTYKQTGPLDMRMDTNNPNIETAATYLNRVDFNELETLLSENSDETFSHEIATEIINARNNDAQLLTTSDLATCVRNGCIIGHETRRLPKPTKDDISSSMARVMQALRIQVNYEFEALDSLLGSLPNILAPDGRVVFLTFHSGEDRRVKKSFKNGFNMEVYSSWSRDVLRADYDERRSNPRSKCAKLRWAIRR